MEGIHTEGTAKRSLSIAAGTRELDACEALRAGISKGAIPKLDRFLL
jgi:hypothetical protein